MKETKMYCDLCKKEIREAHFVGRMKFDQQPVRVLIEVYMDDECGEVSRDICDSCMHEHTLSHFGAMELLIAAQEAFVREASVEHRNDPFGAKAALQDAVAVANVIGMVENSHHADMSYEHIASMLDLSEQTVRRIVEGDE